MRLYKDKIIPLLQEHELVSHEESLELNDYLSDWGEDYA